MLMPRMLFTADPEVAMSLATICRNDSTHSGEAKAIESVEIITIAQRKGHRQQGDDLAKRVERAPSSLMMGRGLVRPTGSGGSGIGSRNGYTERRPPTPSLRSIGR